MPGLRAVVGTSLIGAVGKTDADQTKIDRTVARLCGGQVWTGADCDQHTAAMKAAYQEPK